MYTLSTSSLALSSILVLISIAFSYWQKLKLEKDILWSVARAIIQLTAIGFILETLFGLENPLFTTFLLLFMIFNAAYNAAKRGQGLRHGLAISFFAIATGGIVTLSLLVWTGVLHYKPEQIIPVGGMIISNSMVALGLSFRQLNQEFHSRHAEIEAKLALGADLLLTSRPLIQNSIRTGMVPTIDSAKTLGIVSLPGMMTGLILAGLSPLEAIKFQMMVTFMLLSTTAISSSIACFLAYRSFFNERKQQKRTSSDQI